MSGVTRIVVCDDQGMVRAGFKSLLEAEADLEVVGEASNGQEAIDIVTLLQPDVTLMDIRMPVLDGLAATRHLVEAGVPTSVLVLTTFDLDEYVFEALRAGASGFLLKDAPAEELAAAIRVVAAGDSLLAPGVTRRVIDAFVRRADPSTRPADSRLAQLTPRELEVLGLLARGLSNLDIGRRLFVSEGTTKTHVSNVLTKLGLRDRVQAVIFAYENGVVVPGDARDSSLAPPPGPPRPPVGLTSEASPWASQRETDAVARQSTPLDQVQIALVRSEPVARPIRAEASSAEGLPMTTTTTHQNLDTTTTPSAAPRSSALKARRALLVACPVLAGGFLVLGAAADPAAGIAGEKMLEIYIDNPGPLQWKSTGYHWAYAFLAAPALLAAGYVKGRGAWLATIAAVLGFLGMTTLPGMLITDWYAAGIGHEFGLEGTLAVEAHMQDTMWGIVGFGLPAFFGTALCLPLITIALSRAGRMPWWSVAVVVAAYAAFLIGSATVVAASVAAVLLTAYAVLLARATRQA